MYFSYFVSSILFFSEEAHILQICTQLQFPVLGSFWFSVCCVICVVNVLKVMEQAPGRQYVWFAELLSKILHSLRRDY